MSTSFEVGLARRFESALAQLWMAYQPIVSWTTRSPVAFEALVRSDEPSLAGPQALLDAAARTGRTWELRARDPRPRGRRDPLGTP